MCFPAFGWARNNLDLRTRLQRLNFSAPSVYLAVNAQISGRPIPPHRPVCWGPSRASAARMSSCCHGRCWRAAQHHCFNSVDGRRAHPTSDHCGSHNSYANSRTSPPDSRTLSSASRISSGSLPFCTAKPIIPALPSPNHLRPSR